MAEEKKDWELNPQYYQTNEDGSFVYKKDGTPRKKGGRPKGQPSRGYNYHSSQKAKIAARRSVRNNEKELEKLTRKVNSKKQTLTKKKNAFKKLDAKEKIREKLREALRARLGASGLDDLEFNLGSVTSIDIHPAGWDKTYALKHYTNRTVWFVGDMCQPGGNDHSLRQALAPEGRAFATTGPIETAKIVKENILPHL